MCQFTCAWDCGNFRLRLGESYLAQSTRYLNQRRPISLIILSSHHIYITVMSRFHRFQRVCRTPVIRRGFSLQRCATAAVIPSVRVTTDIIHAPQRCCICSVFTWCYVKELGRLRGKYRPAVITIPRPCPLSVCAVLALVILGDKSITVVGILPILPSSLIYTVILADDSCACIKASTLSVLTQGI